MNATTRPIEITLVNNQVFHDPAAVGNFKLNGTYYHYYLRHAFASTRPVLEISGPDADLFYISGQTLAWADGLSTWPYHAAKSSITSL